MITSTFLITTSNGLGREIGQTFHTLADAKAHKAELRQMGFEAADLRIYGFSGENHGAAADAAADLLNDVKPFGRKALARIMDEFDVLTLIA